MKKPDPPPLALRLAALRRARGLTVHGLAKVAGLDPAYMRRLCLGKIKSPSWDTVQRLAKALDVPVTEFAGLSPLG